MYYSSTVDSKIANDFKGADSDKDPQTRPRWARALLLMVAAATVIGGGRQQGSIFAGVGLYENPSGAGANDVTANFFFNAPSSAGSGGQNGSTTGDAEQGTTGVNHDGQTGSTTGTTTGTTGTTGTTSTTGGGTYTNFYMGYSEQHCAR